MKQFGNAHGNLRDVDPRDINKLNKPVVNSMCARAMGYVENLSTIVKELKQINIELQGKLIESQQEVIGVQKELTVSKSEQIEALKKTVETSVTDSVK